MRKRSPFLLKVSMDALFRTCEVDSWSIYGNKSRPVTTLVIRFDNDTQSLIEDSDDDPECGNDCKYKKVPDKKVQNNRERAANFNKTKAGIRSHNSALNQEVQNKKDESPIITTNICREDNGVVCTNSVNSHTSKEVNAVDSFDDSTRGAAHDLPAVADVAVQLNQNSRNEAHDVMQNIETTGKQVSPPTPLDFEETSSPTHKSEASLPHSATYIPQCPPLSHSQDEPSLSGPPLQYGTKDVDLCLRGRF